MHRKDWFSDGTEGYKQEATDFRYVDQDFNSQLENQQIEPKLLVSSYLIPVDYCRITFRSIMPR
jgi:hypothetical protein